MVGNVATRRRTGGGRGRGARWRTSACEHRPALRLRERALGRTARRRSSVACWRRWGRTSRRRVAKGDPVVVHGRLQCGELRGRRRAAFLDRIAARASGSTWPRRARRSSDATPRWPAGRSSDVTASPPPTPGGARTSSTRRLRGLHGARPRRTGAEWPVAGAEATSSARRRPSRADTRDRAGEGHPGNYHREPWPSSSTP